MQYQPLSKTQIKHLLNQRFKDHTFKCMKEIPHPYAFAGMEQAVEIIANALKNQERITIVGDYDVDGVVGTTILFDFFQQLSSCVDFVIPNRFHDGYGLSSDIIARLQTDLVITVDNGITAHEAAELCKKRGIKLIITDHHTPLETLPCADVIINPKLPHCSFPQKEICGANVGWYLIAALKKKLNIAYDMSQSLDLLALAIIADVMPLVDINRLLLKKGLECISTSNRPALKVIKDHLKKEKLTSDDISYQIAPLLNSAGRMEDATLSVNFLMSKNIDEAQKNYDILAALNLKRKEVEQEIYLQALTQIKPHISIAIVHQKNWHEGVLGIVASKLCDKLHMPSFVLTEKEGILKGSGRSFGEINLIELLNPHAELLKRFGGHKGAVGLEIELKNLETFKAQMQNHLQSPSIAPTMMSHDCIGEIAFEDIDKELLNILDTFEPYGEANSKPRFICRDVVVEDIKNVGVQQNHTSFILSKGYHRQLKAIAFNQQYQLKVGESIDILFMLGHDTYVQKPQLIIEELKKGNCHATAL